MGMSATLRGGKCLDQEAGAGGSWSGDGGYQSTAVTHQTAVGFPPNSWVNRRRQSTAECSNCLPLANGPAPAARRCALRELFSWP